MKILLTMAGMGSRFKTAGYDEEKYAIQFRGHSLLEWSLVSLANFREFELILITREFDGIREYASKSASSLGFTKHHIIVLESMTKGQAETAAFGAPAFEEDDSILIFNTDTFIDPAYLHSEDIRGEGWVPTFSAPGDKWSFAEADETGRISRMTEKVKISDHCSVGLYYFSSFRKFYDLAQEANFEKELYVAPLYNPWIAMGHETYIHELPSNAVTVLGTPEDLMEANSKGQPVWPENYLN